MGWLSTVGGWISSACSAISSALSGAGSTILTTVGNLAAKLQPVIGIISTVVRGVGVLFNILKPQERIEDIGEKVLQAAEKNITIDSCNNDFEEYKKRIDEFNIDPEKKHSEIECQVAGTSYVQLGLEHTSPYLRGLPSLYTLMVADNTKGFFTGERIAQYAQLANEMKVGIDKIKSYFDGSLSVKEYDKVDALIHTAEKNLDPNYSEKEFNQTLSDTYKQVKNM